ncbi:MAG: isoleucine--tRNA ligase [Dehalococcoidia bacterium]|nr:isoleucine--tRNA ligase [Dehalococcoidia bacterium]
MFKPVGSKANFAKLEEVMLVFWRENEIFRRSIEQRKTGRRFTLYEGPPTANGKPGIHHVISRVFKDVIPRYKSMQGYYAPRIAGWDTHGLPVELEVEKQLGLSNKTDIERFGIDKFNALCRDSVFRYLKEWDALTERIGFWVDLEHPYITMDNSYIESGWWILKQLWERGLIYHGYRVTPHCPRCGTSLSSHEVAQGYKDDTPDPSVFVKFRVLDDSFVANLPGVDSHLPVYLLAWTTTPWTLPGNTALAVCADADYMAVQVDGENLILACARVEAVGLEQAQTPDVFKGREMVGLRYAPLYNPHDFAVERRRFQSDSSQHSPSINVESSGQNLSYRVISTAFVTMDDGTGIVHVAPAFGEADFEAGRSEGLDFVQHVDLQGKITGNYPFSRKFVKSADKEIISELKSRGLLLKAETMHHTYPFCWRCSTPLLYYAKQSWYIRTSALKERMLAGNSQINWVPEHIKDGRFGDWLSNNVDWAFSRERYWGTPLPVWQCDQCCAQECVGGLGDLKAKPNFSGLTEPLNLHRPYVDEMTYSCSKCGGKMKRVAEVIDCWFDSGAMPVAQWHYPFAQESGGIFDDGRFPADYICEAVDQTRGWFYSLHALSTLLFDRPCYKNVICLGHILDGQGEKMSKSRGNVVEPLPLLQKHGADALRWYLFTAAPPGNARRFSEALVGEVTRQFMLILWNVYSFFVTYANIDRYNPAEDKSNPPPTTLDRWILSELNQLVKEVTDDLDGYNITDAGRAIERFVDYLSNWYVRRSRRRFWKSESDTDKLAAYQTLYKCLTTLSRLLAPFMPFLADEIYRNLVLTAYPDAPESVHLDDFPVSDEMLIDKDLSADMRLAMKVSSLGRAARAAAAIKVRQPLSSAVVRVRSQSEKKGLARSKEQILEELNIKELLFSDEVSDCASISAFSEDGELGVAVDTNITPELAQEGLTREIVHRLQNIRKTAGFEIADYITSYFQCDDYVRQVIVGFGAYIRHETLSREIILEAPPAEAFVEEHKLDGHVIVMGVLKTA